MSFHLLLPRGHGVDGAVHAGDGDGCGGAELFATVFAEQYNGELAGCDVEAAAYCELLFVGDAGWLQGSESWRKVGRPGLLDERNDDQVAGAEVGFVVVEGVELQAVSTVERSGREDEQDAVAVDEGGERLLGVRARSGDHRGENG